MPFMPAAARVARMAGAPRLRLFCACVLAFQARIQGASRPHTPSSPRRTALWPTAAAQTTRPRRCGEGSLGDGAPLTWGNFGGNTELKGCNYPGREQPLTW